MVLCTSWGEIACTGLVDMRGKWGEHIGVICWSHDLASHDSERIDNPGSGSSLCNKKIQFNKLICN